MSNRTKGGAGLVLAAVGLVGFASTATFARPNPCPYYNESYCRTAACNSSGPVQGDVCSDCSIAAATTVTACTDSVFITCYAKCIGGVVQYNPSCAGTCVISRAACVVTLAQCQ